MAMHTGTIQIACGGAPLTIAHARWGEHPRTLVLLHGGSGSRGHWARNVGPLAEHFSVVVPDLPGYGDSGDIPPGTDMDTYVELVCETLRTLLPGQAPFHLAGFSYGGLMAGGVAVRLPQRVRALTLLAPSGFGPPVGREIVLRKRKPGMSEAELDAVFRHNVQDMMLHRPEAVDDATVALYRSDIERARFRNWQLSWADVTPGNLARIRCPLQLIWGERDRTANPSLASRLEHTRAILPDVPIHILPATGHWAQYERPREVNGLLSSFHLAADVRPCE
ncbi:MAG: alpha/beta fold hydrolase [Candidatus Lambdaproteobacteria bacterium]|nr:alpha/beta fold hydrolase [Candidatus Lambdaproteobacteria bacterium]